MPQLLRHPSIIHFRSCTYELERRTFLLFSLRYDRRYSTYLQKLSRRSMSNWINLYWWLWLFRRNCWSSYWIRSNGHLSINPSWLSLGSIRWRWLSSIGNLSCFTKPSRLEKLLSYCLTCCRSCLCYWSRCLLIWTSLYKPKCPPKSWSFRLSFIKIRQFRMWYFWRR